LVFRILIIRKGIATKLIRHAIAQCASFQFKNPYAIVLEPNTASRAIKKSRFSAWVGGDPRGLEFPFGTEIRYDSIDTSCISHIDDRGIKATGEQAWCSVPIVAQNVSWGANWTGASIGPL